ncbi:peptidyl-prolyl cis-trans isomerase [Croceicoccus sp. BE223]|uniref:peptidyl-prolyl cis-trans isomerase n=1 Tax=Croceicoccus sp. BE223 TaxID=2817716 RepID=UPI002855F88F|nr:peptidyl-prolyl cis-trans isomerase [Croceicoccus sp. BE223]MDR7103339.1 peptidyl-prolyl cis-trans isomerase D [Croceicoccus sp. BE223]
MIQGFRKLFQSRLGVFVALAFVGLMALAFASADITGGSFGGIGGGERVATVGDEQISTNTYRETLNGAFDRERQENPQLTLKQFIAGGGDTGVLDSMIERLAVFAFATEEGLRIGESLIGSELKDIPVFQGPDGKFSQEMYEAALRQRGISDKLLREDLKQGLSARVTLVPAQIGTTLPEKVAAQYARLLNETRRGSIALIPSAAFAGDVKVTDAALQSYLSANRARYSLPERRTVQYALIDLSGVADVAATDAEIAAYYNKNKAQYAGKEARTLTQLVLPTEAGAKAVLAELGNPSRMAAVASGKGLSTVQLAATDSADLATKTSPAVAQAVYAASQGAIAGPVRGPLGWYLMRVDSITRTAERPLSAVRGEIATLLNDQKRTQALAERAAAAEEQLNGGASLAEIAKSFGAQVQTSGELLADGRPFGNAPAPSPLIARLVPAVFAMDPDGDPQIAASSDGKSYAIFAPGKVTPSAPPPFAALKPVLERDYRLQEGGKLASKAADRVLAAIQKGQAPAEAIKLAGKQMPPVDQVNTTRQALTASGGAVPPALGLMFQMAKGTTKKMEGPRNLGFIIVDLDAIETRPIAKGDPLVLAVRRQLGQAIGGEMGEQLTKAIAAHVGVKRNDTAIKAVTDQMTGNR